jgi:beta-glucosidase
VPRSSMGWPVEPDAFREILTTMYKRYGLPIYVTENGTAHADKPTPAGEVPDAPRIAYLKAYTDAMFAAIADGVDVRGYFVWSLLDNFEWSSGLGQRFGLVYMDYPTLRRLPKQSFHWFADLIKTWSDSPVPTV